MRTSMKLLMQFAEGVAYSLRDLFTTAIAAGSVNGTLADTGQTRTVTDTNSKLSITGGKASFATGGVGGGNPGLWYPSEARVLGKVLIGVINVATSSEGGIGWDTAQAGIINDGFRFASGTLQLVIAGATKNNFIYTQATDYTCYQVMRSASVGGYYFFIKGGTEFLSPILIYKSTSNTGAAFPSAAAMVGTTSVFTADDMRIPVPTYIPPVIAYDTFTRADGALGSTETAGPDAQIIAALAWAFSVGIWTISTNKAIATPVLGVDAIVNGAFAADTDWTKGAGWTISAGTGNASAVSSNISQTVAPLTIGKWYQIAYTVSAFAAGTVQAVVGGKSLPTHAANATYTEIALATTTAFLFTGAGFTGSLDNVSSKLLATAELFATVACSTPDVFVEAAVTISGASAGLPAGIVVNLDSTSNPQNYILAYLDGNANCVLVEFVAGVPTVKFTTAVTYSAGAILTVVRLGTFCLVYYNNLAVNALQTMTANTNVNHGVFDPTASNSLDNVTITPMGTSNEYAGLAAV